HGPQPGAELGVGLDSELDLRQPTPDRHHVGQVLGGPGPQMVVSTGFHEVREALHAPPVEDGCTHREHPLQLVARAGSRTWAARTRTNGGSGREVTVKRAVT